MVDNPRRCDVGLNKKELRIINAERSIIYLHGLTIFFNFSYTT